MHVRFAREASRLFEYPDDNYLTELSKLERNCQGLWPAVATQLALFELQLRHMTLQQLRELYTRTFDLTPVCAPYLSVHLFGEGSFKRAKLMTGLREAYSSKGLSFDQELPDHIAIVLSVLDQLDPDICQELVTLCLGTALRKMHDELVRQENPYAFAVAGLEHCVAAWMAQAEVGHA